MVEFKETNPVELLLEHCNRPMRDAQLSAAPAFPVRAFDAMLVGCCGVRQGAHPLRRRLGPRIFRAVEEFATPRIAPRASALLRAAVEHFVRRIWQDAVLLPINRGSICVHAADVDAAIEMSGADRLVGRRRMSGCSCAACLDMGADGRREGLLLEFSAFGEDRQVRRGLPVPITNPRERNPATAKCGGRAGIPD